MSSFRPLEMKQVIGSVSISILIAFVYVTDGKKQPHIIFVVADDLGEFLKCLLLRT